MITILRKCLWLVVIVVVSLAACTYADPKIPYGVWESTDPSITMDINPELDGSDRGGYPPFEAIYITSNGDVITLSVAFSKIDGQLHITDDNEDEDNIPVDHYFVGHYNFDDDTLTFSPGLSAQEDHGTAYEEIIFTKTKDYDVEETD